MDAAELPIFLILILKVAGVAEAISTFPNGCADCSKTRYPGKGTSASVTLPFKLTEALFELTVETLSEESNEPADEEEKDTVTRQSPVFG